MNPYKNILRVLFFLILLVNIQNTFGLTRKSEVSVLTFEPEEEPYTIFGHSAIRIQDEALGIDNIYNFGMFDFSSPFFYIKFMGGNLDYFLSIYRYKTFLRNAYLEQRTIHQQTINLSLEERDYIYLRLNQIYNSKERFYKYDFFYDNCATRIRDLLEEVNFFSMDYDTSNYCCTTFRELLKPYMSKNYWINLGVNLALGKTADKIAKGEDFMFLPDFIDLILKDSKRVLKVDTVIDMSPETKKFNIFSIPLLFFVLVFILGLFFYPKTRKLTFYIYHSLFVLLGVILLLTSLFLDNLAFRNNCNVFWSFPALFVLLFKANNRRIFEVVYATGLIVLLIFGQKVFPGFSWTYYPWISLLVLMSIVDSKIIYQIKKKCL